MKTKQQTEKLSVKKVLVPIDFSKHSKHALSYAVSFAKQFKAELLLVYVVEATVYPADLSFGQVAFPSFEKELRDRGKEELDALVKSHVGASVKTRIAIRSGKAFLEIIRMAEEEHVDLIIIATHGHTGVEHLIFGSTAEKVVRKAQCPVLVLR
jgi:nucleotide-binding universal stress UspA family protein